MNSNYIKYFLFFIYLIASLNGISQSDDKLIIEGTITDQNGLPVPYANVNLHRLPDSSLYKSAVSNDSGIYVIKSVKSGEYYLAITGFGYKSINSSSIKLINQDVKNLSFQMTEDVVEMKEVVISVDKKMIRQEAGTTIMNVENSPLTSGLSTADVLKRVPGVTVDKDGKPSIKGRDGVLVMIDGNPLYMDADQVGNLLQSIPADLLKEVEVQTSPGANQDAAGNAGIINIKLKKGVYDGLNGSVNGSAGQGVYPKLASGVNLSYKKNKLTLSGGYQYNYRKNLMRSYIERNYSNYQDSAYNTYSDYGVPENAHSFIFNGSYNVGKKSSISWNSNALHEQSDWSGENNSYLYSPTGALTDRIITTDDSKGSLKSLNSGLRYKNLIDSNGTQFSMGAEYNVNSKLSHQNLVSNYTDAIGNMTMASLWYWSDIPVHTSQWNVKADYTHVLKDSTKIETGVKHIGVTTNSNTKSTYVSENNFQYIENIEAAYILLGKSGKKWKYSAGLRGEYTYNKGTQFSIDTSFTRKYFNLFPSLSLTYRPTTKTGYTFLYSRRIDRPYYEELNPFSFYSDPYSSYSGNPYLRPQYTHHFELTLSKWSDVLLTTIDYSYVSNPQSQVIIIQPGSLVTTFTVRNLVSQQNIGLSFSFNHSLTKWWTMNSFAYFYNNWLRGDLGYGEVTVNRFAGMFNTTNTFKLPWKLNGEVSAMYETPHYYGTILYRSVWQLSAGLQRKVMKDRLSLKLAVTDIFWKHVYVGEGTFGETKSTDSFKWDNRVVMFSLSYRFGKNFMYKDTEVGKQGGGSKR